MSKWAKYEAGVVESINRWREAVATGNVADHPKSSNMVALQQSDALTKIARDEVKRMCKIPRGGYRTPTQMEDRKSNFVKALESEEGICLDQVQDVGELIAACPNGYKYRLDFNNWYVQQQIFDYDGDVDIEAHAAEKWYQVISAATTHVGCAFEKCSEVGGAYAPGVFLVCSFYPIGKEHPPYKKGNQKSLPPGTAKIGDKCTSGTSTDVTTSHGVLTIKSGFDVFEQHANDLGISNEALAELIITKAVDVAEGV